MSMQHTVFSKPAILASGGYYVGLGVNNRLNATPYNQELDWAAFTPTSTNGTITLNASSYKVYGSVCVVNLSFRYTSTAGADPVIGSLPYVARSNSSNVIIYMQDTVPGTTYLEYVATTVVDTATLTISSATGASLTTAHLYDVRGQLRYQIIHNGDRYTNEFQFNPVDLFMGNVVKARVLYFKNSRNDLENNILTLENGGTTTFVGSGGTATIADDSSRYRRTNNTVGLWLFITFTKVGVAQTATFTGLPYNAVVGPTAATVHVGTIPGYTTIVSGFISVSGGTLTVTIGNAATFAASTYRVMGYIEYEMA